MEGWNAEVCEGIDCSAHSCIWTDLLQCYCGVSCMRAAALSLRLNSWWCSSRLLVYCLSFSVLLLAASVIEDKCIYQQCVSFINVEQKWIYYKIKYSLGQNYKIRYVDNLFIYYYIFAYYCKVFLKTFAEKLLPIWDIFFILNIRNIKKYTYI